MCVNLTLFQEEISQCVRYFHFNYQISFMLYQCAQRINYVIQWHSVCRQTLSTISISHQHKVEQSVCERDGQAEIQYHIRLIINCALFICVTAALRTYALNGIHAMNYEQVTWFADIDHWLCTESNLIARPNIHLNVNNNRKTYTSTYHGAAYVFWYLIRSATVHHCRWVQQNYLTSIPMAGWLWDFQKIVIDCLLEAISPKNSNSINVEQLHLPKEISIIYNCIRF